MVSADFRRQLKGFGLTTVNILYRMPDHPGILQSYVWQLYDLHPHCELREFLDFWSRELDGPLHSVTVAHAGLIRPAKFRAISGEFSLGRARLPLHSADSNRPHPQPKFEAEPAR